MNTTAFDLTTHGAEDMIAATVELIELFGDDAVAGRYGLGDLLPLMLTGLASSLRVCADAREASGVKFYEARAAELMDADPGFVARVLSGPIRIRKAAQDVATLAEPFVTGQAYGMDTTAPVITALTKIQNSVGDTHSI